MAYITTPVYYVNDDPHIGHIYTTVVADVLCRWYRLSGEPAFLLTGTDEHAAKVVEAAKNRGFLTSEWARSKSKSFKDAFHGFNILPSDFIRTSETRHVEQVAACMRLLLGSGDIYRGEYEGWYDTGQEEYVSEVKARQFGYASPINRKPLVRRKESCFFFRLSAYGGEIRELIETGQLRIYPGVRKEELLTRLEEGLRDVPCSRPRADDWGIVVPGSPDQTVYVWIDALVNYLSAINTRERRRWWPPTHQIVGKDILWFHAVIWPAMLLALRKTQPFSALELPQAVHAHSFWVRDGEKMSKSMGNFVSVDVLRGLGDAYGVDSVRFFLVAAGPHGASDADFSMRRFHEMHVSALANTVGNCCSRVTTMIERFCDNRRPEKRDGTGFPIARVTELIEETRNAVAKGDVAALVSGALAVFRVTDSYIHSAEPFRLAREPSQRGRVSGMLHDALEAIRLASLLLWPLMPERMQTLWSAIGVDYLTQTMGNGSSAPSDEHFAWGGSRFEGPVASLRTLFPKVDSADPSSAVVALETRRA
jgi:methionyl-tRNA synthetase